jgi:tRNA threonylcarbamoyladenosine biosynthesis protein TsaE
MQKTKVLNKKEVWDFGKQLAKSLKSQDVVALYGDLGVGKTYLSSAIIHGLLGAEIEVLSPTFNLVHTYDTDKFKVWHFDLYRLDNSSEVYELGIEDAFNYGISLIEWPEIVEHLLPSNAIKIHIKFADDEGYRELNII